MKRYFRLLCVVFAVAMLFGSCLKGSDSESVVYHDTAISSFSLGTLKMEQHTESSTGADSVYYVDMDCTDIKFHIDQTQRYIFNTDSLPIGIDLTRVPCTVSAYNNGVVWISSESGDELTPYSSSDSIDFSNPVKMRVYAYNSGEYAVYTVKLNVHKQDGSVFKWEQMSAMTEKAQEAFEKAQVGQPTSNGGILVGRSTAEFYSLTADNWLMVSKDNGQTWEYEMLDDDASWLPTVDFAYVSYPYSKYTDIDYVLIGGGVPNSSRTHFWYKIVDYSDTGEPSQWSYIEVAENNFLYLPRLTGMSLMRYDGRILAVGIQDLQLKVYESKDGGITWKESTDIDVPEALTLSETAVTAFVDADNYIWLMQTGTGQLWRARHNRLGWK